MTNENDSELWLPVLGFEGKFDVSDLGNVRGYYYCGKRRLYPVNKKPHQNIKNGYLYVVLTDAKNIKGFLLHRLVLSTFDKPMPKNIDCRHLDGNKLNCRLDNLKWGTRSENEMDKLLHGTMQHGERNGNSKLTDIIVKSIRVETGLTTYQLSTKYNISQQNISCIRSGKTWKHI